MEKSNPFVDFFRIFGANVLLRKNILKTRKHLLSDDYISKQELAPMFTACKSYFSCKKLFPAKFLCNLERLEPTHIHLKKAKNTFFAEVAILKWM